MEIILLFIGGALIVAGILGSVLPVLPGPPLAYAGLLLLQLASAPFSIVFLVVWAFITGATMILDNIIPAYGTKKFGGTPYGVWGSIIGMAVGLFFAPIGIVAGPLAGAFCGELVAGQSSNRAVKSAMGSFVGLMANIVMKVIVSGMMGYYFIISI